jgi:hypothetical protein
MAQETGTLGALASALSLALLSLKDDLDPDNFPLLLIELGLDDPPSLGGDAQFVQRLGNAVQVIVTLPADLDALAVANDADDAAQMLSAIAKLIDDIARIVSALDALAQDLIRATSSSTKAADIAAFADSMVERILEHATVRYLETAHPSALSVLNFLGLTELAPTQYVIDAETTRLVFRRRVYFDRLGPFFSDALAYFKAVYGWGADAFDAHLLFDRVADVFVELGQLCDVERDASGANPPVLDLFVLTVSPKTDAHPAGLQATLFHDVPGPTTLTLAQLSAAWQVNLVLGGALSEGLTFNMLPPSHLQVAFPAAPNSGAHLQLLGRSPTPDQPFVIFGAAGGGQLLADRVDASIGASLASGGDIAFNLAVSGAKAILDTSQTDSFLSTLLGSEDVTLNFDIGLGWSSTRGFYLSGGSGVETAIGINLRLGAFALNTVHFVLGVAPTNTSVEVSLDGSGAVGPVSVSVERVGVELQIVFHRGNLGLVDLDISFKPPTGAGLAIDAAGVTGGGFLKHDDAKREYAGVLQLQFINLALQAFGLITTQVEGGSGYSLLALIDAEFPPIQLGWGFTLEGVGGLFAVHRTASTDALHAALKAGQLSSILFPKNAITNAPVILAQLDAMFPTAHGRFLFGPMALIGWGKPRMLKASIAVVVELPEPVRVILLSRIEARLPNESKPVVRVNMDVLGVLDLGKNELSFDGMLFDSKIIDYTLSGTMALRAEWGSPDHREFVLAIGGVHPRFTPPPDFPQLQRITINMPSGSISKLRLAAYMAVTANAVQFGANLDVSLGASGFGVSGHLGFDALLQIIPFHFDSDISGKVAITADGDDIASVDLEGTLSGPKPYHIAGQFKVHIVFFDVGVSFDYSWGGDLLDLLAPAIDVADLLETALADVRNWDALLPAGISPLVTVRQIDNAAILLAHPLARPGVHQSVVPLGLTITRFGEGVPSGGNTFTITGLRMGSGTIPHDTTQDDFAPAQFFELTDDEKLERPSFERHDAGLRAKAGDVTSGAPVPKTAAYETFYMDTPGGPLREDPGVPLTPPGLSDLHVILQFGSAGRAATRSSPGRYQVLGNPIRVTEPAFVLADKTTMAAAGIGPAAGATFSEMHALLAGNRALQILATHEMTVN